MNGVSSSLSEGSVVPTLVLTQIRCPRQVCVTEASSGAGKLPCVAATGRTVPSQVTLERSFVFAHMAHRFVARSSFGGCAARVRGSSGGGSGSAGLLSSGHAQVRHGDCGRTSGAAPAPDAPWHHRPGKRARSLDAFPTIAENDALRRRSLMVSKSITSFARFPERRPAGVVPAGDGSLDVDQLWVCWGLRCGFSRTQLLQHIADHAISDSGRRRFLLHSDHDGRTWVTVAAPLRRMPRRHRRGAHRRSPPPRGSAVDKPVSRPSHISVSSEDDFVDDADVSADIPGLHEEDPAGDSADPDFPCEDAVPGDLDQDVKLEHEVKTEETLVDDCSLAPTVLDVGSQTCKDEPQDSKEDTMPSAQVFSQSVPSLSPVSTVDSRSSTPPPGQTLDFREDSPSPPFNVSLASKQLGCPDPSPTSSPYLLFLALLPTPFFFFLPHTASPRLSLHARISSPG